MKSGARSHYISEPYYCCYHSVCLNRIPTASPRHRIQSIHQEIQQSGWIWKRIPTRASNRHQKINHRVRSIRNIIFRKGVRGKIFFLKGFSPERSYFLVSSLVFGKGSESMNHSSLWTDRIRFIFIAAGAGIRNCPLFGEASCLKNRHRADKYGTDITGRVSESSGFVISSTTSRARGCRPCVIEYPSVSMRKA